MKPKTIAILELSLLALLVALFLWWTYPKGVTTEKNPLISVSTTTMQLPHFPDTPIEAQSAYVYDVLNHKSIYEKGSEIERPLASLTKLMSALTASKIVPSYLSVRISPDDIAQDGDTGLYVDEKWNVDNLIDFSLITSSNDGIHAVAAAAGAELSSTSTVPVDVFVKNMNDLAKEIGLINMRFYNATGLDISSTLSGGYGSANDVVKLVNYILDNDPHLLEATTLSKETISSEDQTHVAVNTDLSIPYIPDMIASKTGYTDLSGGNVVVAFNAGLNHPIIIAVLGSSYDGRFKDLESLASSTIFYLNSINKPN